MPRGFVEVDGKKIRRIRKEKASLGLCELAAIVGIAPASLYQIEVRRQTTMPYTLKKIAKALRVKPEELARSNGQADGQDEAHVMVGLEQDGVAAPEGRQQRSRRAPAAR